MMMNPIVRTTLIGIGLLAMALGNLLLLYLLLAMPPIHLFYDAIPPAGPSSVYVPGSGFSGFWFHLGALQAIPNIHDYDFYCYSSGCLSVVLAGMNVSLTDAFAVSYNIQQSWLSGNMSRFDMVDVFLQDTIGGGGDDDDDDDDEDTYSSSSSRRDNLDSFLPNLNILVTSRGKGVEIVQPQSRMELVQALKQTTWIPFVTGEGVLRPPPPQPEQQQQERRLDNSKEMANTYDISSNSTSSPAAADTDDAGRLAHARHEDDDEFYLDGGFSRVLHPECEYDLFVPNTWINMLYTLNPALTPTMVDILWQEGSNYDHPLLTSQ